MYIRRKVFSLLQDENGEEKYFSTREILMEDEEERLFSILDEEDLEQREFGRKQKLARKAERAAHNAEMHTNRAAKLMKKTEAVLQDPKSSSKDIERLSKNKDKIERLSKSVDREVDSAIETALKKNPKSSNNYREIKIGSGESKKAVRGGKPMYTLDTVEDPRARKGGIMASRFVTDSGKLDSLDDKAHTKSGFFGNNQPVKEDLDRLGEKIDNKLKFKKAEEELIRQKHKAEWEKGIARGKRRDEAFKLRDQFYRNNFDERVRLHKFQKAAERERERILREKSLPVNTPKTRIAITEEIGEEVSKKGSRFGKAGKIIAGTAAALGLAGAVGYKRYKDKKNDNKA